MPPDGTVAGTDLNYLLFRQQVERTRASTAASAAARKAHAGLADLYQLRIERLAAATSALRR